MKVSYNEIIKLTQLDVPVNEMVQRIGSQLGEVENVESIGEKYTGATIVKVVSCEKHPDADKLSICLVDDNGAHDNVARTDDGLVQVVCGAPNVHADMWAVWLPPGATVPVTANTDEPFVLDAREIRGVVSNGMLASHKELAIGDAHAGIVELNQEVDIQLAAGQSFADTFGLNDYIIDIENKMFTHRPDCFGTLGVAREVAGIFGAQFTSPQWYNLTEIKDSIANDSNLAVQIETDLVSRFSCVVLNDVTVAESPMSLQIALAKVGIRPINNIVDITNYVMHYTAQPLHAYDYDKLAQISKNEPTLIARESKKGEQVELLNGQTITFDKPAIVIATDTKVVGIGGIMGGAETEVSDTTTKVVIEAANFDMYSIRRTSMHYGLFSDAANRFNKGQSACQTMACALAASGQAMDIGCGVAAAQTYDVATQLERNQPVEIDADFINQRLGTELSAQQIADHLTHVEFLVDTKDTGLVVTAPFWRTDIHIAEDIVEEIGRLVGYDNVPLVLPLRSSKPTEINNLLRIKQKIRQVLSTLGANEVLTYSFVHRKLFEKTGQDTAQGFAIINALSPELHFYRQTLMPSLLDKVHGNIKAGYEEFALFEIGKTHNRIHGNDAEEIPAEIEVTSLLFASNDKQRQGAAYFVARTYLERLAHAFGAKLVFKKITDNPDYPITKPYDFSRSSMVYTTNDTFVGMVGEFTPAIEQNFKLPRFAAGFDIDTGSILASIDSSPYAEMSRFPRSTQDITLQTADDVSFSELENSMHDVLKTSGYQYSLHAVSRFSKTDETVNTTFKVTLWSQEHTLTTDDVTAVIDRLADTAANKFGATQL